MKLILLNGPPGSGKSTLARRYAADHPPALALDVDRIRAMIGGRRASPGEAGLLARDIAAAAARTHLGAGHDVVVPQLVVRAGFPERLEALASECGASFHEVVLPRAGAQTRNSPALPGGRAQVQSIGAHRRTRSSRPETSCLSTSGRRCGQPPGGHCVDHEGKLTSPVPAARVAGFTKRG
ncbi:AAA family ATPase [Amycolatopsis sp. CA-126428]|uniref:AAA family ATPase n=1 Tax=Amycolatopsis sp. CA-126428 TaxID=2073158 RepID=UPI001E3ABBB6|nr:AAA family ATPase [Amycolatopsis sp. CA-126428]